MLVWQEPTRSFPVSIPISAAPAVPHLCRPETSVPSSSSSSLDMTQPQRVQVLEQVRVSLPPGSVADDSVLLTFLDVLWLHLPPVQRLFFYQLNYTKTHILHSVIPNLKHSLSLSLQLFYPLAGNLIHCPETNNHFIQYTDGDSVRFTIAESDGDFNQLSAKNNVQDVTPFHPLVPLLLTSDTQKNPILALQVTVFPNFGISIGTTTHHAAADGSTSIHFMKSWASIYKSGGDISAITLHPIIDRTFAAKLEQVKKNFFMEMEKVKVGDVLKKMAVKKTQKSDVVRATFVLTRAAIEHLRQRVMKGGDHQQQAHYSSYMLTCAYVWVCLVKSRKVNLEKKANFSFPTGCRARLNPPLPPAYFGNCLGLVFADARGCDLNGEDGIAVGSEAIRRSLREVDDDPFRDAHRWISRITSMLSELIVTVAGSPKLRAYETDFGWGRPTKVDVTSIECTGAISLAESRDEEGGLEVGLALPKRDMDDFVSFFKEGLGVLDLS